MGFQDYLQKTPKHLIALLCEMPSEISDGICV